VYFSQYDCLYWTAGQERALGGGTANIVLERSGANNMAYGYVAGLRTGAPVALRVERKCDSYSFFYRGQSEATWTLATTYRAIGVPTYVGLIMKTWAAGSAFTVDFDYFSFVKPGPTPSFTMTPDTGPEPLAVALDASASQPSSGTITSYAWDFGDGQTGTGQTTSHTFDAMGTYTVKLTVTDSTGNKASAYKQLKVNFGSGDVSPWTSVDVGEPPPVATGGARFSGACIDIYAGGRDIGAKSDQFHFVYQSLKGDCSVEARLAEVDWPVGSKVGVMLREDLTPGSRYGTIFFNNTTAAKYQWVHRDTPDDSAAFPKTSTDTFTLDARVRIVRAGTDITASYSSDGVAWTVLGTTTTATLALPETVLGGLVATAHDLSGTGQALEVTFCDISVTGNSTVVELCANDIDDDGDELTDCADPDCTGNPACPAENCANDIDDDGDELTDCADPDCTGAPECPGGTPFHRGDPNNDGTINITDGIYILNFLFLGGPAPTCREAANPNDDATVNITDGIYVLNFLFLGGPPPTAPGPATQPCGLDPEGSPTDLGCDVYTKC
jgi:PKD repeat protein